jgi:hypothetical protein
MVDNLSLNVEWSFVYYIIKRWLIYYLNERLKQNDIGTLTIGKTFPYLKLYILQNENLTITNIINAFENIIIRKATGYNCIGIKYIIDASCSFYQDESYILDIVKLDINPQIQYDNDNQNDNQNDNDNNINVKLNLSINNSSQYRYIKYDEVYSFISVYYVKFSEQNISYLKSVLKLIDIDINVFNFKNSKGQIFKTFDQKIKEIIISTINASIYNIIPRIIDYLQLLQKDLNVNIKDNNISRLDEIISKLYKIEQNILISILHEDKNNSDFDNYLSLIDSYKNTELVKSNEYVKKNINIIKKILIENNIIDFKIPTPIFNNDPNDNIIGICDFYKKIYPKILEYHMNKKGKKGYNFILKDINKIDTSNYKAINNLNDDSVEYLTSNTSMTNWKEEYDNMNPFGILLNLTSDPLSHKGIYDNKSSFILTYPNLIISSLSNNFLSLNDYYQLIYADLENSDDQQSKLVNSFSIGQYNMVDNLHGDTNIMLPLYINNNHWNLVKPVWSYHLAFINNSFEFDYCKKMDNIYFWLFIKSIKLIEPIKSSVNTIRLFMYILRTTLQVCIENKYSYNMRSNYDKFKLSLLCIDNDELYVRTFSDYLIRLIQLILNGGINSSELSEDFDKVFICLINLTVKKYFCDEKKNINKLVELKNNSTIIDNYIDNVLIGNANIIETFYNIIFISINNLKKDLMFICEVIREIYNIKKFNQLVKYLDKYNGCLPIDSNLDLNVKILDQIIKNKHQYIDSIDSNYDINLVKKLLID